MDNFICCICCYDEDERFDKIVHVHAGMIWSSAHQALKSVETTLQDRVLGTGLDNLVSKQHLELRATVFEYFHRQHASLLHSSSVDALIPTPSTPYVFDHPLLLLMIMMLTNDASVLV